VAKTPPISEEELQLKNRARRRLVGAVVLVLLVVVFVPMFLDRSPRMQKQDIDIKIPPAPAQSDPPPIAAAPPPGTAPQSAAPRPDASATKTPDTAPAGASSAESQAPPVSASPTAPPESKGSPPAKAADQTAAAHADAKPASGDDYVIQIGAFSDPKNAKQLLQKLKAEKVPAYSEAVQSAQGEKTRVRAGPYASVEAAEKGRERLRTLRLLPAGEAKIVRKGE
jgi:DedD protein